MIISPAKTLRGVSMDTVRVISHTGPGASRSILSRIFVEG